MHPKLAQAIQEIDAAVFNGDTFESPDTRAEMLGYISRWTKELAETPAPYESNLDDINDAIEWDDGD